MGTDIVQCECDLHIGDAPRPTRCIGEERNLLEGSMKRWGVTSRKMVTAALLALMMSACGGGGSTEPPVSPPTVQPAVVEYLGSVLVPSGDEARQYSASPDAHELKYSGVNAPAIGTVVVLNDTAYKIVSHGQTVDGKIVLTTATPNFEEVFERLVVSTQVALTSATSSANSAHLLASTSAPLLPSLTVPTIEIKTNALSPMAFSGSLKNGFATVEFDYSRSTGLNKAKLLAQGDLTASAQLRVKVEAGKYYQVPAATPVAIPIPASLGTLSFKLPISLFARINSSLEVGIARWDGTWSFAAGT